jgi:hypothetical protein
MLADILSRVVKHRLARTASLCRAKLGIAVFVDIEVARSGPALPRRSLALQELPAVLVLDKRGRSAVAKQVIPEIEAVRALYVDHPTFIMNQANRDK